MTVSGHPIHCAKPTKRWDVVRLGEPTRMQLYQGTVCRLAWRRVLGGPRNG